LYTAVKRKFFISVCSLLLCFALLVTSSYAWIALSKAPEIIGIQTQVGANGSLEIALLNSTTYADPSLIRSSVGDSLVTQETAQSNLTWGNVIDLTGPLYGLTQMVMIPSRLNAADNGLGGGVVKANILGVMDFDADGRTGRFLEESVSATYSEDGFLYSSEKQEYGVRAIGNIPQHSPRQTALTNARGLVKTYMTAASGITRATWVSDGGALLRIFEKHYAYGADIFPEEDTAALKDAISKTLESYSYFDSALRQGVIGYGAAVVTDPELFQLLQDNASNTAIPLSLLLEAAPVTLPSGFSKWVSDIDTVRLQLTQALTACNALSGRSCSWNQIQPILQLLIDGSRAHLGQHRLTSPEAYGNPEGGMLLTLAPNSGALAKAAEYFGNYSVIFDYTDGKAVEAVTTSTLQKPYLTQVSKILDDCEVPESEAVITDVPLENIYGFAIDLAFRANADTQLLLQTESALRADDVSDSEQMQGGGSSLCVISEQLTVRQCAELLDAMRIGFLDSRNNLLAVAKPNASNYEVTEEGVSAPVYLYGYEISPDGILLTGERQLEDGCITDLTDSMSCVITAVVWLDGDNVSNSLVTIRDVDILSKLNLQFASSSPLRPAQLDVQDSE
jgi:hypothetical protein